MSRKISGVGEMEAISGRASVHSMGGPRHSRISQYRMFSDDRPFHVLTPPSKKVTSIVDKQDHYGRRYSEQVAKADCSDLIQNMASNLYDFLACLESIHVQMYADFCPSLRIPYAFRCEKSVDGFLRFHFYAPPNTRFTDPEAMISGLIRESARSVFRMTVTVVMTIDEQLDDIRHCAFRISNDSSSSQINSHLCGAAADSHAYYYPSKLRISPATFCNACPFHVIFDRNLNIVQAGSSLQRIVRVDDKSMLNFSRVFNVFRPIMDDDVTFDAFLRRSTAVIELQIRDVAMTPVLRRSYTPLSYRSESSSSSSCSSPTPRAGLRLRGQMFHVTESDTLLFVGSPIVRTLDDIDKTGLFLSDLAVHDATRDLIFQDGFGLGEERLEEQLRYVKEDVEETGRRLEEQKERSDGLLKSMLPDPVAELLLKGEEVAPTRYDDVTILMTDLTNFTELTADWEPRQIVDFLNVMYTEFDAQLALHEVYKVETVGDSYMVVGGCPKPNPNHAIEVARQAVDMIETMSFITHPVTGERLKNQLRIGMHSGVIQAGIVGSERPRYCLFGDVVNVTARTLTSGQGGSIIITEYTYDKLTHTKEFVLEKYMLKEMKGVDKPVMLYYLKVKKAANRRISTDSKTSLDRVRFEWMSYAPTSSSLSLERRFLSQQRSVSCPHGPHWKDRRRPAVPIHEESDESIAVPLQTTLIPPSRTTKSGSVARADVQRTSVASTSKGVHVTVVGTSGYGHRFGAVGSPNRSESGSGSGSEK